MGYAGLGLDVPLVHRLGGGLFLHDEIGVFEALLHIAKTEFKFVGDVGSHAFGVVFQQPAGPEGRAGNGGQPLVQDRRVRFHAFLGSEHRL